MEQARIEHAPNGSLLTYITSADALVNEQEMPQLQTTHQSMNATHGCFI